MVASFFYIFFVCSLFLKKFVIHFVAFCCHEKLGEIVSRVVSDNFLLHLLLLDSEIERQISSNISLKFNLAFLQSYGSKW